MSYLTPALLLRAYAAGIFPMAESRDADVLHWLSPEERGVLLLEKFHLPRRLRRTYLSGRFEYSADRSFREVVRLCATVHETSWINGEIEGLYGELFDSGLAHSVEVWRGGELAGGLFGLSLGGVFFGESMFSRERDASKAGLAELVLRLRSGGYVLMDVQFWTRHLGQFGVEEVKRGEYLGMLSGGLGCSGVFLSEFSASARLRALEGLNGG